MLLKIEVYPNTFSPASASESRIKLKPPVPILHASLKTSSSPSILKVGRKEGDVVFGSDKSVSRRHLLLVVKSTETVDFEDGVATPEEARTEEEINACKNGGGGYCVVVKDSSRFGTYVVEETANRRSGKTDGDSSTCDDDETDDEGQVAASQSQNGFQVLSLVSNQAVQDVTKAKLKKVQPGTELVLSSLNHSGRAIIQCGQNGSTIILTKLSLKIAFSRVEKAVKDLWVKKRFPVLGATCLELLDDSLHCLVSKDRIANAKNMAAWSLRKPIVSVEYLEALWDRHDASSEMPAFTDFLSSAGDTTAFWDSKPNPLLWATCTFFSYAADDTENLCRSAGASIVRLYDGDDFQQMVASTKDKQSCFCLSSSAARYSKYVKFLKKQNFPFVKQKTIASALYRQMLLVDDKGNQIGEAALLRPPQDSVSSAKDNQVGEEELPSTTPKTLGRGQDVGTKSTNDKEIAELNPKRSRDAGEEEKEPSQQKRQRIRRRNEEAAKGARGKTKNSEWEQHGGDDGAGRRDTVKRTNQSEEKEEVKPQQKAPVMSTTRGQYIEKSRLGKTPGGWLLAAPKGEERRSYRKEVDGELPDPPITDVVEGLVVAAKKQPRGLPATRPGVKDFKGFRKNRVFGAGNESRIVMRSVLPKESERQRELQEEEEALEEQMREQEELFQQGEGRYGNSVRNQFTRDGGGKQRRKRRAV